MSSSEFLTNFAELIELIPQIQKVVSIGIEKDLQSHVHDNKRLNIERKFLNDGLSLLQMKWNVDLLYILQFLENPYFNEIKRALPNIGAKILTERLRFLEKKRIVKRTVQTQGPIRVTYNLTEFGKDLFKLLIPFIYFFIIPKRYTKIKKPLES